MRGAHYSLGARVNSFCRACCSLLLFLAAPITADDSVLKLATRPNLPPYIQKAATSGIEIHLVKAIFQNTHQKIDFVQMDRIQMIQRFESGEMDGVLTQNTNTTSVGCLTDWYLLHQNVAFSIRSKNLSLKSLADLQNYNVVSFHNATVFLGDAYRNAVADSPLYREISPQQKHISLLYNGEADVVVGDEWIIRHIQRRYFEKTDTYKELQVHQIMPPTLYGVRFQKQKTCDIFNQGLQTIRRSGLYEQIVDSYHQGILVEANKTP
jgi:polar amino acid transport system substrate-binding protein